MQPIPTVLFQERQHPGEDEAETPGGRFGGDADDERGAISHAPAAPEETSFPFPPQDSQRPPPPPPTPPPFLDESPGPGSGAGIPRRQTLQVPGRGRGRGQEPDAQRWPFVGSGTGSGAPPSPPRASTSEALSPQFLGRGSGSDADSLTVSRTSSMKKYQASVTSRLRNLLNDAASSTPSLVLSGASAFDTQTVPPAPRRPSPFPETSSSYDSTEQSDASSFAYALVKRRPDVRMLKKKNWPLQHQTPEPVIIRRPALDIRSASFYKPKVVEDTGFVESTTIGMELPTAAHAPMTLTFPDMSHTNSMGFKPVRKAQTFQQSKTQPLLQLPELQRSIEKRTMSRSISEHALPRLGALGPTRAVRGLHQSRFGSPGTSRCPSQEALKLQPVAPPAKDKAPKLSIALPRSPLQQNGHYHKVTPPEEDPRAITPLYHGEHYFTTFPTETMYPKEFVPMKSPVPMELSVPIKKQRVSTPIHTLSGAGPTVFNQRESIEPPPTIPPPKPPSDTGCGAGNGRKKGSMFGFFKRTTSTSTPCDEVPPQTISTQPITPATPATPGILVSGPDDGPPSKRRRPSTIPGIFLPPYFARPRLTQGHSDYSTHLSPMATIEDEEPMEHLGRNRQHKRSSSEQISPGATPRSRPKNQHRNTLDKLRDDPGGRRTLSPGQSMIPTPVDAIDESEQLRIIQEGNEIFAAPMNGNGVLELMPASLKRTEIVRFRAEDIEMTKKQNLFRNLLHDIRRVSSADRLLDEWRTESDQRPGARKSILRRLTVSRLHLRPARSSMSTTKPVATPMDVNKPLPELPGEDYQMENRGASQPKAGEEPLMRSIREITAADMKVTRFEQTPFTQRYHDSKRATQQLIKSLIRNTLDENDDDGDDIVLGFEHDVPDHFPNSPLCPLHPKHKSGGKAICPLHGRHNRNNPSAVVRVGPSRSRRVVSFRSLRPLLGAGDRSGTSKRMELVFDARDERRVTNSSMGSDGAWTTPVKSDQDAGVTIALEGRRLSESEMRGRKQARDECGSRRNHQRDRMRRR